MTDMIALAMSFGIVGFGVAFYTLGYSTKKIKKLQKEVNRLHQIEVDRARLAYDRLQVPIPLEDHYVYPNEERYVYMERDRA